MPRRTAAWACHLPRFSRRCTFLPLLGAGIVVLAAARAMAGGLPTFTPDQMGGTLRRNFNAEPQTLNPLCTKDVYGGMVNDYIFESLIERDFDTLEWQGLLADKWEVSPDGKIITFHLDPRAKFSDGRPVTADDVLFTYETMMNPGIDCRAAASYFEDCQKCEKVDERTIRFVWKKTYFKSLETSNLGVLPKHVYQFKDPNEFNKISDRLVGSGPYRFQQWKTGQQIVLVRNPNYWRRQPAFDRVTFRFILEDQAAVQALRAGELDEVAVPPEWWAKLQKEPGFREKFQMLRYRAPGGGYRYIAWNNARPLFADKRVRRAMTQLIWREQLMKYMRYGIGTVISGPFWTKSAQYDQGVKPWPYDRAAALRLLKEAGWEDRDGDGWLENAEGKRFEFEFSSVAASQEVRDMARIMSEEFRRAGIQMHVRAYEWSVFVTKLDNRDYDAIMLGWGGGGVEEDPYQIWHSSEIADRGSNHVGFKNAEADRLIEEARMTLDEKRRNDLYHRFHRLLHEEQPYTFMWQGESLIVLSPRIKGVRVHPLGLDWREWWIGKAAAEREEGGP
jgi:peptide/nickel transport system substrate-binding protein